MHTHKETTGAKSRLGRVSSAESEGSCRLSRRSTLLQAPRPGMPVWRAGPAGGAGRVVAGRPGPPQPVGSVRGANNPKPRAPGRITAAACGPPGGPAGAGDPRAGDSKVAKQARLSPSLQGQAGHRDIRPASTQPPAIQVPPAPGSTPQIGAIIGPRCEVADQVHQSPIPGPRRDVLKHPAGA